VNAAATTVADVFPHRFANVTVSACGGGTATATSEHRGFFHSRCYEGFIQVEIPWPMKEAVHLSTGSL